MIALLLTLPFLFASGEGQPAETRPVIMQSLCTPTPNTNKFGAFGFELIQTFGKWSARVYPAKGSNYPAEPIEFPEANVRFYPSPKSGNDVLMLSQSVEKGAWHASVFALSEIVPGKRTPEPFSVTLSIGSIGDDGVDRRPRARASCVFVNEATPHERMPL